MSTAFLNSLTNALPGFLSKQENPGTRETAFQKFVKQGLPGKQDEDWKYTSLRSFQENVFSLADTHPKDDAEIKKSLNLVQELLKPWLSPSHTHLVFLNGHLLEPSSLPVGLSLVSEKQRVTEQTVGFGVENTESFSLLNQSFSKPVRFQLGKKVVLEKPLHLLFLTGDLSGTGPSRMAFPRISFHLADESRAQILESHFFVNSDGISHFSDSQSDYFLARGSSLDYHQMQGLVNAGMPSTHHYVSQPGFFLKRDSRLSAFFATAGASLERTNVRVRLDEENAEAKLSGIYLLEESRHTDFHLLIHHASPHTRSEQNFKGILDGTSRAVFTGKVIVEKGAHDSFSAQLCQNLLLSPKAQVDARPQLEIRNNDVKCSHGATVGRLSDSELFYLRSRGLSTEEASRLLCLGFIRDLLAGVSDASVRQMAVELFRRNTRLGIDL